jgi:Zinc dependent phospholipase C
MAGGYTHLTLVRSALRAARRKFPALQDVLDYWGRFTYLGGVSPDYPYLGLDAEWADRMHKGKTDEMVGNAMMLLHRARADQPDAPEWRKQFAWLLGFVSHIVADVTSHPIVNIRVGKYELNKDNHRRCEMNQDVWIYKKITGLDLHVSDNMKGEIRSCGTGIDLNDTVEAFWKTCLEKTFPPLQIGEDQIDRWHAFFIKLMDLAEIGRKIPVFGRHMASGAWAYPADDELDQSYFEKVRIPTSSKVKSADDPDSPDFEQPLDCGRPSSFQRIFTKARDHILEAWGILSEDLLENGADLGERHLAVFGDWSLDTGIDNNDKRLRFWPWDEKLIRP